MRYASRVMELAQGMPGMILGAPTIGIACCLRLNSGNRRFDGRGAGRGIRSCSINVIVMPSFYAGFTCTYCLR